MGDLISLDRAKEQIVNVQDSDDGIVASLVSSCSEVVETYCRRTFAQQQYDELYHGTGSPYLYLDNPPVTRVLVRAQPLAAMFVLCSDPGATTQAANVEVTSTGVILTRTYNNATTTNTLTYASYPTFGALGAAINLVGNNWSATVSPQFALWQTSDLAKNQFGIYSARNMTVPLTVYWSTLSGFKVNEHLGEVYAGGGWTWGYENYRVSYLGGFDTIPDGIQYATAALVQMCYASMKTNPMLNSETLDKYSYTKNATLNIRNLDTAAQLALNQYKIMRVARYK